MAKDLCGCSKGREEPAWRPWLGGGGGKLAVPFQTGEGQVLLGNAYFCFVGCGSVGGYIGGKDSEVQQPERYRSG